MTALPDSSKIFYYPDESAFYSYCLDMLLFRSSTAPTKVIEFGSGDGLPVIESVRRTNYQGVVEGYEINEMACIQARDNIARYNLGERYRVHCQPFAAAELSERDCLIANPPYLPAADDNIRLPLLYGGEDGATVAKELLACGFTTALLILSSYSYPESIIRTAVAQGYRTLNFVISPAKFSYYSSEPAVQSRIKQLRGEKKASYSENVYLLAGVLFQRVETADAPVDLSDELIRLLTTLYCPGEFRPEGLDERS
jgi:hypothetical protein